MNFALIDSPQTNFHVETFEVTTITLQSHLSNKAHHKFPMKKTLPRHAVLVGMAALLLLGCSEATPPATSQPVAQALAPPVAVKPVVRYPSFVTAYDIQTPEDEFYYHHLQDLCDGSEMANWPVIKHLMELGQNLVDAPLWARLVNESIYITDQPRARPIIDIVNECAEILGVDAPPVHIEGNGEPNAYIAGLKKPHVLVLTSGLLDLYEESPNELRFIIGHELGHLKAGHLRTHFVGRMFVGSIQGTAGGAASFATGFVTRASVSTLLHWYRESEYSADRAGLLCLGGNMKTAKQALLRLQHQTKPSNRLMDPNHPDFDPELVLAAQIRLLDEPFVNIITHLKRSRRSHPFIPERCAALQQWSETAEFLAIMERTNDEPSGLEIVVTSIELHAIPKVDTYVPFVDSGETDPFVKVSHAGAVFSTGHYQDVTTAKWSESQSPLPLHIGGNLIIEVFDYNSALANRFVGSCLLPMQNRTLGAYEATSAVQVGVKERSTLVELPQIKVRYTIR